MVELGSFGSWYLMVLCEEPQQASLIMNELVELDLKGIKFN
jgi:hypothetical protein